MLELQLNMFQALAVAALVYCLGSFLVKKIAILGKYCIPAPVVGGLVFAIVHVILRSAGIVSISFDTTLQTFFMTVFFTSVGFTASFRLLKKGGKQVLVFLAVAIGMVVLQNLVGSGLAGVFGLDPRLGLCVGSIPMVGGHGTSGSFGQLLDGMGVTGASTVAIASATFGLVAGSMLGGPIARRRINKHGLHSEEIAQIEEGVDESDHNFTTNTARFTQGAIFMSVAMGLGIPISELLSKITIMGRPMTFPSYIGAMLAAVIIRNIWDAFHKELPSSEIETTGGVSLSLFLSFALMGLRLWELADLALPMIVMLLAQTTMMGLFAYFVVFNIMGRDYEAAVMTTAFCGFGMGATPNAMANMQAVTKNYGPAPRAFFVVPLVGSLFIDFFNSLIITTFLSVL